MCLSTGQAAAQSYARLWKDAQAAMNDDKPKTALQTVERIVAKATAERQEAQLLKGVLVRLQLHQDIAPDSAKKVLRQLEETAGRPDGMTPEAAALWRSAAGQLCMKQWGDTAAVSRGKGLLRASVADFERLHQAKATNYLPLFVEGKDSRYFQNDLLSVLAKPLLQMRRSRWRNAGQWRRNCFAFITPNTCARRPCSRHSTLCAWRPTACR